MKEQLPKNGDKVLYFFEPFNAWYIGTVIEYDLIVGEINYGNTLSVCGRNGFTSWYPEVTKWLPYTVDNLVSVVYSGEIVGNQIKNIFLVFNNQK